LSNNSFQGEFPLFLRNLKKLLILDIGENKMSGTIPSWIGDIFSLIQILRLRQNNFQGYIPSQLCKLSALQILDLSNNMLIGSIPHCIGNLTAMIKGYKPLVSLAPEEPRYLEWFEQDVSQIIKGREYHYTRNLKLVANVDLSNNNLSGPIPIGITLLTALQGLNLSHNHLSGEIPTTIENMKSLESLDFSHDQLSSSIPHTMSSLTFLSVLNLSYNNLSGPIPQGNQFSTLNNPSIYVGNKFLCGAPLSNICDPDENDRDEDENEDKAEKLWFYFVVAIGFATGFGIVIGVLLFKKCWRHAYFKCIDETVHKINVTFSRELARLKKTCMGNPVD
jgi:hypothetical protein